MVTPSFTILLIIKTIISMAKIIGGIAEALRGSIDGVSFYKMRGVEGTIVRAKGGFTKERIKTDPKLERLRLAESEFGARAKASKHLMRALVYQKPMADYNIAGPLTKLLLPIQELDLVNDLGKRGVPLSIRPQLMKGFSLNRNNTLDSVIRYPLTSTLSRETGIGTTSIPQLVPDINFFVPAPVKYPYYRFCLSLGAVPDIVYADNAYLPVKYPDTNLDKGPWVVFSPWFSRLEGSLAQEMSVQCDPLPADGLYSLLLGFGIQYGELKGMNNITPARYAGCAKVLEAV
jgi:hypothetical protein